MTRNKSIQEVQTEVEAVQKEIVTLQNKQTRLNLLQQVQRQGVARPLATWFVAGNTR